MACHGVLEALDAKLGAKDAAETDVSISAVSGGIDIGIVGRAKNGVGGIVLSEGVERDSIAHLIAYRSANTILGGKVVLPRHPVFVGHC